MSQKPLLPVLIDLSEKKIVCAGIGKDPGRWIIPLLTYADDVTVIDKTIPEEIQAFADEGKLHTLNKPCGREDIYGADLVITSGEDAELTKDLSAVCRCLGIFVSILSDPKRSDFVIPVRLREETEAPEREPQKHETGGRMKVAIFTDGAARGNPEGPGGYGTILQYTDKTGKLHEQELSGGYQKTTNNRMELMAAIVGMEALTKPCTVDLYSDSQYLVNAFEKNWIVSWQKKGWRRSGNEPVKNRSLWERLLLSMKPHEVRFHWVKGHDGHPENERCDKLATTAADGTDLLTDDLGE